MSVNTKSIVLLLALVVGAVTLRTALGIDRYPAQLKQRLGVS